MRSIGHSDPGPIKMDAAGNSRSFGVPSASAPQADRTIRKKAILIFCLLMFCYAYVHQRSGWNQNSRLDLLHAIFVHKTLKIDAYHENTGDKSTFNGHYFSDKAPGIVVLALPVFSLSVLFLGKFDIDIDYPGGWLISDWITTAGSVGLLSALGGAAMFVFLCKFVERRIASLTTFAVFAGSVPFAYATMLFSHAAVAGLLSIALWAIADGDFVLRHAQREQVKSADPKSDISSTINFQLSSAHWKLRHVLAGMCCGFAIASEFPAAIAAGGVLLLATVTKLKRGFVLATAAIPPLLLIPAYNWICFGGPLTFGYHNLALTEFQEMNKGLFGITFPPKASAAYLILLSPERGLFFWTPFIFMAFAGLKLLWRSFPTLAVIVCLVAIAHVLAISGYYMPSGGAALGPRHLAPMLPLLAIACSYGTLRRPMLAFVLAFYSILWTGLATLITALPPEDLSVPITSFYLQRISRGAFTPNLGQVVGCNPYVSLLPIVALWGVWLLRSLPKRSQPAVTGSET